MSRPVWVAYPIDDEDDIAEAITREDVTDGLRAVRGILTGIAVSLAIWGLIIAAGVVVTFAWLAMTR